MVNQSGTAQGDPVASTRPGATRCATGCMKGFDRAYNGNRAPLIIGNHFESWNGGTYMRAVEEVIEDGLHQARGAAASPSGSWPTGWTRRTPKCSPKLRDARRRREAQGRLGDVPGRPEPAGCSPAELRRSRRPRADCRPPTRRRGQPGPARAAPRRLPGRRPASGSHGLRRRPLARARRRGRPARPGRHPVFSLPQLSAFFRWKCTIWRV